jgi:hypothetical protein
MRDPQFFLHKYAPVTTQMAFVEMPASEFADALFIRANQMNDMWNLPGQVTMLKREGSLADKLDLLLPLTSVVDTKTLVSEMKSNWAAYIPNGHRGGDVNTEPSFLSGTLKIRTLSIVLVTDVPNQQPGSAQFVLSDGRHSVAVETRHGVMYRSPTRSIAAHKESRWEFSEDGERLPFEETEKYEAKKIKDRLTFEMIERYCGHLGIELFDPDFYAGNGYVIQSCPPPNSVPYPHFPNLKPE